MLAGTGTYGVTSWLLLHGHEHVDVHLGEETAAWPGLAWPLSCLPPWRRPGFDISGRKERRRRAAGRNWHAQHHDRDCLLSHHSSLLLRSPHHQSFLSLSRPCHPSTTHYPLHVKPPAFTGNTKRPLLVRMTHLSLPGTA